MTVTEQTLLPTTSLWEKCLARLEVEMTPEDFYIWIRPLQLEAGHDHFALLAPNRYVLDWVNQQFFTRIMQCLAEVYEGTLPTVHLKVGSQPAIAHGVGNVQISAAKISEHTANSEDSTGLFGAARSHKPNPIFTFENFVEGKSNQLARAAALQVAAYPGVSYNPLFIYGGVGLGKTHLMQAVGNVILQKTTGAKVLYLHSERFVADMVKALQRNAMDDFKRYYRSAEVLLIDDIQFFAGKDRSQEEFFHTFNSLLDAQHQVVITCDRYPKEIVGLEERLKSRFGWGLTVAVEPPDLETRVAILMSKAEQFKVTVPHDVAFFIGKRIRSNVRELEGALRRVTANAQFTGQAITVDLTREALKDLLAVQAKLVTIENIQKTVADYYKIKMADLLSKKRTQFLARARQVAMTLAKELTNHSLPEIGDAFGGRDHTTVLHACRKVKELMGANSAMAEDYKNLLRVLST